MNTVVRRHVPASSLPEEFRQGIDPTETVTVTVEVEDTGTDKDYLDDLKRRLREAQQADLGFERPPPVVRLPRLAELGINPDNIKPISLADIRSITAPRGTTVDEAVRRIRALRDEWDD